jgi:hypothetical protein
MRTILTLATPVRTEAQVPCAAGLRVLVARLRAHRRSGGDARRGRTEGTHTHNRARAHARTHTDTPTHKHTRAHKMRTHAHTHTDTHTQAYTRAQDAHARTCTHRRYCASRRWTGRVWSTTRCPRSTHTRAHSHANAGTHAPARRYTFSTYAMSTAVRRMSLVPASGYVATLGSTQVRRTRMRACTRTY